jgi:hypothetical protein
MAFPSMGYELKLMLQFKETHPPLPRLFALADRQHRARFAVLATGYVKKEPGRSGPGLAR